MSALSGIYGQGGMPETIIVNLGLSSKFKQGDIEDLFEGYAEACRRYKLKISDLNIDSSLTGLAISVTAGGSATGGLPFLQKANHNDLICVTGDLGAAYMGLQILEREWKVFEESKGAQPMLEGYEYIIGRQLKPELRKELPGLLAEKDITITSLSVINEGLASSLIGLCKKSDTGCRIYQDKIPVSNETGEAGSELGIEPIISALNGGDDYEFVFTVPVSEHDKIDGMKGIRIIGHITPPGDGHNLVLQDGNFAEIKAQGWS
jgi:thiamine-monophosphate kinase